MDFSEGTSNTNYE